MKNKKSSRAKERNVWKIVSAVFIVLFILILAWGLMNTRPRPAFTEPTQGQIDMAKAAVAQDLQARGDSIDNYKVFVTNRVVGFIGQLPGNERPDAWQVTPPGGMENFRNLQVSLRGNSTAYLYLVGADSGKILMRSFTEWFGK